MLMLEASDLCARMRLGEDKIGDGWRFEMRSPQRPKGRCGRGLRASSIKELLRASSSMGAREGGLCWELA